MVLKESDSWNPVVRMCTDVADLTLEGLGKLECRPVRLSSGDKSASRTLELSQFYPPEKPLCIIPPEVECERIGYVAVGIDEGNKEALLLGFTPTAGNGELFLGRLQSLYDLLDHLQARAQPQTDLSRWAFLSPRRIAQPGL